MIRLFAFLATALLVVGCGQSPQEKIVGVWYDPDEDTQVEFFEDGRIVVDDISPIDITGTYRLLDDGRMSLDLSQGPSESVAVVVTYQLDDDDTLILVAPDGDTSRMERRSR